MARHRIYDMPFGDVYPLYVAKAERKGRTKAEVDEILRWLTGYSDADVAARAPGVRRLATPPQRRPATCLPPRSS